MTFSRKKRIALSVETPPSWVSRVEGLEILKLLTKLEMLNPSSNSDFCLLTCEKAAELGIYIYIHTKMLMRENIKWTNLIL